MPKNIIYTTAAILVRLYAGVMLKLDIERHCDLPAGPKIIVANHPSATDPFLIHAITREQINVLITVNAFNTPVFGRFLRAANQIPVSLEKGGAALEHANQNIRDGYSVAIFIEGRTSPLEGGFMPPRTGAARLALQTGVPVIPVGIYLRRDRCLRIRSKIAGAQTEGNWYLRGPYSMTVGEPLHFSGDVEDREYVRSVTETIMKKIRMLAHESENRTRRPKLSTSPAQT
jgi:1-acyl-sn-glycerol-3-phosphate acyltransferase